MSAGRPFATTDSTIRCVAAFVSKNKASAGIGPCQTRSSAIAGSDRGASLIARLAEKFGVPLRTEEPVTPPIVRNQEDALSFLHLQVLQDGRGQAHAAVAGDADRLFVGC